ncbi:MAG: hypothetical protein K9J42_15880 [Sulfuritalea sp.]|nr:hypothetical protein [Sulfuritalea sp.]
MSAATVASVLWLVVASASAQGPHRAQKQRSIGDAPQRMFPAEQRGDQRDTREALEARQNQRLSVEERRQLRRDVHEAGRDLYRERMRPGRRPSRRE